MRAAAMSACANAAGRVQALSTSMLADLREMEDRHDEKTLGDLLKLDHATAQAGRLADSIAVLTGARSGRRWTKPIVMESILRGSVGRISAYQRVRIHSTSTAAIAGYAAEGVMHALAELMDNATSFSPPSEEVHVYVEEVQTGIVVTVEDGGLAMSPAALERAERAVSAETLDLTTLSGTRLGLAVVGCLARKHGLTVSFRPSSRGGTGVVVMIPRQLITQRPPELAPSKLSRHGDRPPYGDRLRPERRRPGRHRDPHRARGRGLRRCGGAGRLIARYAGGRERHHRGEHDRRIAEASKGTDARGGVGVVGHAHAARRRTGPPSPSTPAPSSAPSTRPVVASGRRMTRTPPRRTTPERPARPPDRNVTTRDWRQGACLRRGDPEHLPR